MAKVNIEDLAPGMVLAADAVLASGRAMLRAGQTLTEKHIQTFKAWGLTEASVEGVSQQELEESQQASLDPAVRQEIETRLQALFRHADLSHPAMSELYRLRLRADARAAAGPRR
jgi:hypothetical protein